MLIWCVWLVLFFIITWCCLCISSAVGKWQWIRSTYIFLPQLNKIAVQKSKSTVRERLERIFSLRGASFLAIFAAFLSLVALYASVMTSFSPSAHLFLSPLRQNLSVPSHSTGKINLFIIDCSGSMAEPFVRNTGVTKLEAVQNAIIDTLKNRSGRGIGGDLIGVNAFSRVAITIAPLMYDRELLYKAIKNLQPVQDERLNGTSAGYALFKTVAQIVATKQLKEKENNDDMSRCILISDGVEDPHPLDRKEPFRSLRLIHALQVAAAHHIAVDYIFIGQGLKGMASDERDRLIKAIEGTGGEFREVQFPSSLTSTLEDIFMKGSSADLQLSTYPENGQEYILIATAFICISYIISLITTLFHDEKTLLNTPKGSKNAF